LEIIESQEASMLDETPPDWVAFRTLLADLHDDLPTRTERLRHLWVLESDFGQGRLMMPGGHASSGAYIELRHAFVCGNFLSAILLSQCLLENILAAHVNLDRSSAEIHGRSFENLPQRPSYLETLEACQRLGVLSPVEIRELMRLSGLRNAVAHFRSVDHASNLERRSMDQRRSSTRIVYEDARFAVGLAVRILAKPQFVVGGPQGEPQV